MSLFENLRNRELEVRQELTPNEKQLERILNEAGSAFGGQIYSPTKSSEYLKSATGWIYGCVNSIADDIAGIRLKLFKVVNGEPKEIESHPILDLLYRANNVTTYFDLVKMTFQYLELTGEAPWFVGFQGKKPAQIMLLRPDRLTIVPGTDGEIVGGYKYRLNDGSGFKEINLEPFEVVPLRYPNPDSPLRGLGPLSAAATTYDLDASSERWNNNFFSNAASPSLAFETDKVLSKEIKEKLEKKIKEKYEGVANAHKTLILESGIKAKPLSLSQKDMDFIEQQRFSRDKILAIFRVPKTILGLTEEVNRATAEASEYVFAKRTIKPKLEGFVQQLNEFLIPLFDQTGTMYLDFDDPVPQNVELKIQQATGGVQAGYMTINEARELFGLDPVDGGDTIREPISFNPLLNDPSQNSVKASRTKKEGIKPVRNAQLKANLNTKYKKGVILEEAKKAIEEKMIEVAYGILKQRKAKVATKKSIAGKVFNGTPVEQKQQKLAFQTLQLNIADDYEPKFIQKLNKVFEEQKKDILERITDNMDAEKDILSIKEERVRYEKTLRPTFMSLLDKQAEQALRLIGQQKKFKASSEINKIFDQYFLRRVFKFSGEVTSTTNELVGQALRNGIAAGESVPKLRDRVRQLFSDMEVYRAERIARSETIRATNFAAEEAWVDSGVVEAKEWVAFRDERTDDECIEMDGKIIPLRENFFDKGDKFGNLNLDYEFIQHPPLHVNCRCTLVPVVVPPGQRADGWKPKMSEAQALAFIKGSVNKETWVHGTNLNAATNIEQNGFRISRNLMGPEAVYFAKNPDDALNYAKAASRLHNDPNFKVLKVKLNIKKFKVFEDEADFIDALEKEFGPRYGTQEMTAFTNKWDAVLIRKTGRYLNYLMVRDPKNVVVFE